MNIEFLARLKDTPSARPIKIGADQETEITLIADGSQIEHVVALSALMGVNLRLTVEVEA